MSDQMASVLQSMQDYIEHHYLDEMMDEIEAVIDMEHKQHLIATTIRLQCSL